MDFHVERIDSVIQNAISVMEESKDQVFEICEAARRELQLIVRELDSVLEETDQAISKVDELERNYRLARRRLTEVSRDFLKYTEQDIKLAYEKAAQLQLELTVFQEKESYLKKRRDELQKRAKNTEVSIERADAINLQMSVVLDYLSGDLHQVTRILESAKNRQMIGMKIILAQEDERKRIAREIHDGPAQSLAHLVMRTEIAERVLGTKDLTMIRSELVDLKTQIRLGLEELRKIIFNLRPMALDDLGLVPTLRKFVQDFEEKTRIRARLEVSGKDRRLPSAMEAALYRLVQEAFNNALKHAQASYMSLEITQTDESLSLSIADNGVGFYMENAESNSQQDARFGLIGMKERVELLQGTIVFDSAPGQGTKIKIAVPIREVQERS